MARFFFFCIENANMYELDLKEAFTIGRSKDASFAAVNSWVSRRQCILVFENDNWYVIKKGSVPTFINKRQLDNDVKSVIMNGDILKVVCGNQQLQWVFCKVNNLHMLSELQELVGKVDMTAMELSERVLDIICERPATICNENKGNNVLKEVVIEAELSKKKLLEKERELELLRMEKRSIEEALHAEKRRKQHIEEKLKNLSSSVDNVSEVCQQVLNSELECSICTELFISAVTLNCMHSFCEFCWSTWKKKVCPTCRSYISRVNRCLALDNLITTLIGKLGDEAQRRRAEVVRERREEEEKAKARQSQKNKRKRSVNRTSSRTSVEVVDVE